MLKDNVKIKTRLGEYKDFPYTKELYIYGARVWTDDFPTDVSDEICIGAFIEQLEEECL